MAGKPKRRKKSTTRRMVQAGFLAITLVAVFVVRANAEAWCPFGGVEAIYNYVVEGNTLCSVAVSNFFILGGVLLSVLLLRRAFCGYACPIGTVSEWLQVGARRLGIRPARVPSWLDKALSTLKYVGLVVIVFLTWQAAELIFRGFCPAYALLGRHGEDITVWAYVVSGAILLGSLFVTIPFCRWLCPLAAVLNPFSLLAPTRIARNTSECSDCGECARACPMAIPVDQVEEVTHARCTACLECLDACPLHRKQTLTWRLMGGTRRALPRAAVVVVFLLVIGVAVAGAKLFPLPSFRWTRSDAAEPVRPETVEMMIDGLGCRGSANLLVYFLERDDDQAIPGYLRLEAWPDPEGGRAKITYDAEVASAAKIKAAITKSYFDEGMRGWRDEAFVIEGYDPLEALFEEMGEGGGG